MMQKYSVLADVWGQQRLRAIAVIVLLLSVTAAYAGQRWIVEPSLLDLRTEQLRLQQHVRARQAEFVSSGVPVSAAEQLEKNLQQFDRLIPSRKDFPVFIGELFAWSEQSGLDIHQVSYQPQHDEDTGFLRYGLSFSVKGDYAQVKKFIHLLENTKRILLIDKISLSGSSSAKSGAQDVDLRIELATYFQGGPA